MELSLIAQENLPVPPLKKLIKLLAKKTLLPELWCFPEVVHLTFQ